jgi:hypothetical protein
LDWKYANPRARDCCFGGFLRQQSKKIVDFASNTCLLLGSNLDRRLFQRPVIIALFPIMAAFLH